MKYIPAGNRILQPAFEIVTVGLKKKNRGPPTKIQKDRGGFVKFIAVTAMPQAMTTNEIKSASAKHEELYMKGANLENIQQVKARSIRSCE